MTFPHIADTSDTDLLIADAAATIRDLWAADYDHYRAHINAVSMQFQDARCSVTPAQNRRVTDTTNVAHIAA